MGCFAGDNASDLFRIQGTLNHHGYHCEAWRRRCDGVGVDHGYHSILQRNAILSDLRLVGLSFVFQQDCCVFTIINVKTSVLSKRGSLIITMIKLIL